MKNLLVIVLALAAIAGGVWKFYLAPQQEKEKAELAQRLKADEDARKAADDAKKAELSKLAESAKSKSIDFSKDKPVKVDTSAQLAELEKTCIQRQDDLKKLKAEAGKYTAALQDWEKKNPYELGTIKEYQDRASKARDAMIETAKAIETKKQALTLAQNEHRKAASQMRTGRSAKAAIGWRYMKEPEGVSRPMCDFPKNSHNGPTILVYSKDTRNEDAAAVVQTKIDGINQEIATAVTQYNTQKAEIAKIKDEYKTALESKQAEFKPAIEKFNAELKDIKQNIEAIKPVINTANN